VKEGEVGLNSNLLETVRKSTKSWLLLTKEHSTLQHGGNDGYADELGHSYAYDSTVANHGQLEVGDCIVLWNGSVIIGISRVDRISTSLGSKSRNRCPKCGSTKIKPRKTILPIFRCQHLSCGFEFDEPIRENLEVTRYVAQYSESWCYYKEESTSRTIRGLAKSPQSIQSMRELNHLKLIDFLERHSSNE
jgi:ribosomal protein L37AE/L43A